MATWTDIRDNGDLRESDNLRELTSYAIQSQYSASERILALAAAFQSALSPPADANLLYDDIVNIYTATGISLDRWGRILGIGRVIHDAETGTELNLADEDFRQLLLYKAMANIAATEAAALNALLLQLVNTGIAGLPRKAYVLPVDTMVVRWVFENFLTDTQSAVFKAAGTLARGAGVGWELYAVNPMQVFGFDGSGMQPFNQAPFAPDNALIEGQ